MITQATLCSPMWLAPAGKMRWSAHLWKCFPFLPGKAEKAAVGRGSGRELVPFRARRKNCWWEGRLQTSVSISKTVPVSQGSLGSRATWVSTTPLSKPLRPGLCFLGTEGAPMALARKGLLVSLASSSVRAAIWSAARGVLAKRATWLCCGSSHLSNDASPCFLCRRSLPECSAISNWRCEATGETQNTPASIECRFMGRQKIHTNLFKKSLLNKNNNIIKMWQLSFMCFSQP